MPVTREQIQQARRTDLYNFLIHSHSDLVVSEGTSLRPRDNKSISIKRGYCGYMDFASGEKGNSLDYLTRHMGYNFQSAVIALCDGVPAAVSKSIGTKEEKPFILPKPLQGRYKQLYAYLTARGIDSSIISDLVHEKIMYQEAEHNNIVFCSATKDFCELHGTLSDKPFHGVLKRRPDCFWWYMPNTEKRIKRTAYICEAAIDAISLYQLRRENAVYISIAGVANQQTIDRIVGMVADPQTAIQSVVLAVDNDNAGEACRARNPDIPYILPKRKDWNEDLLIK